MSTDRQIRRESVERLRNSSPSMLQVLTQDIIRVHLDRIEPSCVADLFALAETKLPLSLRSDLNQWSARASREILDIPDGETRRTFVAEIGELAPEMVPLGLRRAIVALIPVSTAETAALVEQVAAGWDGVDPTPVTLPTTAPKPAPSSPGALPGVATRERTAAVAKPRVVRTPAAMVDPRRGEWVREDAVVTLKHYGERGLKESILVAGLRHRSPYKDLTEEEVKAELRKLERERKLKHTGERWLMR